MDTYPGNKSSPPEALVKLIWRSTRRVVVTVIGATVVLLGVAMLVLPGPGIVTVLAGVAILALEFAWARRFLKKTRHTTQSMLEKLKSSKKGPVE